MENQRETPAPERDAHALLKRITDEGFNAAAFNRAVDEYVANETDENDLAIRAVHPSLWMTREEIDDQVQDEVLDLIYNGDEGAEVG